jgi:hypothetical protein
MYILSEKVKNKSDFARNLESRNLGNDAFMRKYLKKGQLRHSPSSVKEWYNSIYNLENNNYVKALPFKDKLIYKLFYTYFNINKSKKYDNLSMGKIFIGKPEIKHFNNKIYITLYIFNKWIMRFYKMTNMIKTAKIMFSQKNKQFSILENRSFLMGVLLLKHPKFDQKLTLYIKKFLIKMFNGNNRMFFEMLYMNVITFFDKTELYKLLGLRKDTDMYIEKSLVSERGSNQKIKVINKNIFKISRLNKKVKTCLYLYLYIVKCFFDYIGFPKLINILGKVLLRNLKEKRTNCLKTMLNKLGNIYLTMLKINSLHSLVGLINLFLMLKKILKSIYIMEWYKKNIYYSRYKFNIRNILVLKNILNKLYNNNKIEINIINLKYLYLDGNVLALAVVKKLKSRKRRILRVIRMALRLSKKPYINKFYSNFLNINSLDTVFIKKTSNSFISNNIPLNKDLISKPISYKSRIVFYYLKHRIISGMKLQGTGRLTKRLTASRSISKYIGKGSLKNRASSYNGLSTVVLRGYVKSSLQYVNTNSYNRIGAYGIKSWISSY